jgi:hypothetical protein
MRLWNELNLIYTKTEAHKQYDGFHDWLDHLKPSELVEHIDDALENILDNIYSCLEYKEDRT